MAEIRRVCHGGDEPLLVLESMAVLGVAVVACSSQNHQISRWADDENGGQRRLGRPGRWQRTLAPLALRRAA
jgi:hypothetical protein